MNQITEIGTIARELWNDGKGPILLVISMGSFLAIGTQMLFPVLLPHIRSQHGISLSGGGLLLTVLFFSYSSFQLLAGIISDRWGEGHAMTASLFSCAVAIGGVIMFESLVFLFVATIILGFSVSGFTIARMSVLPTLFSNNLGAAAGVTFGSGDMGQAILPPAAGILAVIFTWQMGPALVIPFLLVACLWTWHSVPPHTSTNPKSFDTISRSNFEYIRGQLFQSRIVYATVILFVFSALWMAFGGMFPEYLINEKGLSPEDAGLTFGFFFILGIVIKPISGALYDRLGVRRAISMVAFFPLIGFLFLSVVNQFWLILVGTGLVSIFLGSGTIAMSTILKTLPEDITGTGIGVIRTASFSIAALIPYLVGVAADGGFFNEAIMSLTLLPMILLLIAMKFPD